MHLAQKALPKTNPGARNSNHKQGSSNKRKKVISTFYKTLLWELYQAENKGTIHYTDFSFDKGTPFSGTP
jgi:hypothetical protein